MQIAPELRQTPLVSIIIPCYNAGSCVGEAIESALAQTYPHLEVIVIDDGSTDNSLAVIRAFSGRIRWESGPNRGACAARNRGLAIAAGALIQFLDADDLLYPEKLATMVPIALAEGRGVMVVCDWNEQSSCPPGLVRRRRLRYDGSDPVNWMLAHCLQTSSPLHWRDNLTAIDGFDVALPRSQEFDLHLRLMARGMRLVEMAETLFLVRRREDSLSSSYVKILQEHPRILLRLQALLKRDGRLDAQRTEAVAATLARAGLHLVQRGYSHDAQTHFAAADAVIRGGRHLGFANPRKQALSRVLGPSRTERLASRLRGTSAWIRGHFKGTSQ